MSANKFVLKHHQIEIDYIIGASSALPALTYKDGTTVKTYSPVQITTEDTSLGSLVSIPLLSSIDAGGDRFGFFLPKLDVAAGETKRFTTVGVNEQFSGPDSFPQLPPSWGCIEMHGTAQSVIVPLVAKPVPA